jgi:hypothetical protein
MSCNTIRTYYTTRINGEVRRLDNFTLPWVDVSVPAGTDGLLDVMTFPKNPDKVIVVGRNHQIFKSIDAGANWTTPGGNYHTTFGSEFNELWIVDDQISYVTGDTGGAVLKSIDGGDNYNIIGYLDGYQNNEKTSAALHFISPLIGVVAGSDIPLSNAQIYKTTDGGATWTLLNTLPRGSQGIYMSNDEQTIVAIAAEKIWRSTDGGVSFTDVYTSGDADLHLMEHLTWTPDGVNMWVTGTQGQLLRSVDNGATWTVVYPANFSSAQSDAAHFYDPLNGFFGRDDSVHVTSNGGSPSSVSEAVSNPLAIWTEEPVPLACYRLDPCNPLVDPVLLDVQDCNNLGLDTSIGQVINISATSTGEVPVGVSGCYTVTLQESCGDTAPEWIVDSFTLVGSDCASFELETCPVELPLTLVGDTTQFQVTVVNTGSDAHDFSFALGSCTTTGLSIISSSPINVPAGGSGVIDLEYTPTLGEQGTCELQVTGPCGTISCDICFSAVAVPACPHFNICITGPSCAPDCIKPGEVISFDLGGTIDPVAYPTVITFQIVNQVTQEVVFTVDYGVADDTELDAIIINVPGLPPGKYCAEVCLPGCNTKRILCFDVCEPFDIYKDSCNNWHVHRPPVCEVEEYLVSVKPLECGAPEDVVIDDVLWDVSQDNTFEFELPGDGIYIFEMKDPETGGVVHSFSAFETCALQECYHILMDKIMCSCSDPCCKRCDGAPEEHREFARMTLNKLVPLYMTYLGMAYRNKLYTVGSKLVQDDHMCFLHDACAILAKIHDIIMDCGCLCPEQKNTATNRGDCSSC